MKKYLNQTRLLQVAIIIVLFLSNLLMVLNSFVNISMTNSIIALDMGKFMSYLFIVVGLMILVSSLNYCTGLLKSKSKKDIAVSIRHDYLDTYIKEYALTSGEEKTNEVLSKLTNDTNFVIDQYVDQIYIYINFIFGAILPLIGAALIHWSFLIIFPLSSMISVIVVKKMSPLLQNLSNEQSEENKNFVAVLNNLFHGFSTLFSYKALDYFNHNMKQANENLEIKRQNFRNKQALIQSIIMIAMVLAQFAYIIDVGYLTINKVISPGSIVGLMSIASSFYNNTQNLIGTKMQISSSKPIIAKLLMKSENSSSSDTIELSKINKSIYMDHVSYAYEGAETNTLDQQTMKFRIGGKYLIQGESGVGKSTILKLITGRLDGYIGNIYYDDVDIRKLSSTCLRNLVTYVSQDTYIFGDTIKQNITLGKQYDEATYNYVIHATKLKTFIESKSDGDQFILEEFGKNISGGQRQRIALARAMLFKKQIFVIDEGLQGLDKDTADELENLLLSIEGITLIMISHRDSQIVRDKYDEVFTIGAIRKC